MDTFTLTIKQLEAYRHLTAQTHADISELVFGGGARGGKTFLGAFWVVSLCAAMPGSKWLIGREELKALKRTTLRTLFKVLSILGYKRDVKFHYNAQDMVLTFANGSVIFFAELKRIPSDPEFDRLGSYDLTGAWVDEAQEVCKDAKDALQFRLTELTGKGWTTTPKTLYTCNPGKTWLYTDFWKPIVKERRKIAGRHFITSLYEQNNFIDHATYRKTAASTGNKVKIARLLHGEWEYDDDPNKLMDYEKILDLFTTILPGHAKATRYLSCDIARKGNDYTIIGLWCGLQLIKVYAFKGKLTNEVISIIEQISQKANVRRSNIVVDEDGVGGGVVDGLPGCKGFINNSSCIQPRAAKHDPTKRVNYANLKTQCAFKLAQLVNAGLIGISDGAVTAKQKEFMLEELDIIKQKNPDNDKTIEIQEKKIVKEALGRSPDYSDMMLMRMIFEVQTKPRLAFMAVG